MKYTLPLLFNQHLYPPERWLATLPAALLIATGGIVFSQNTTRLDSLLAELPKAAEAVCGSTDQSFTGAQNSNAVRVW